MMTKSVVRRAGWILILVICLSGVMAQNDDLSEISGRIAEKVHASFEQPGNAFKETLMSAGLSAEDSDRIGKTFVDGLLACLLDAARLEAEEQAVSFEDVLLALELAFDDPEHREPTIIDTNRVDAKADACAMVEMQKAGVSVDLMVRHAVESSIESAQ